MSELTSFALHILYAEAFLPVTIPFLFALM